MSTKIPVSLIQKKIFGSNFGSIPTEIVVPKLLSGINGNYKHEFELEV